MKLTGRGQQLTGIATSNVVDTLQASVVLTVKFRSNGATYINLSCHIFIVDSCCSAGQNGVIAKSQ